MKKIEEKLLDDSIHCLNRDNLKIKRPFDFVRYDVLLLDVCMNENLEWVSRTRMICSIHNFFTLSLSPPYTHIHNLLTSEVAANE